MTISAVQYLKIPKFESEVVYEAKTDKVSALLVDKDEYPSMTKDFISKWIFRAQSSKSVLFGVAHFWESVTLLELSTFEK